MLRKRHVRVKEMCKEVAHAHRQIVSGNPHMILVLSRTSIHAPNYTTRCVGWFDCFIQ